LEGQYGVLGKTDVLWKKTDGFIVEDYIEKSKVGKEASERHERD